MPNWVKNKLKAPTHVINAILKDDRVDFSNIKPFLGNFPFDGISVFAEDYVKYIVDHPKKRLHNAEKYEHIRHNLASQSSEFIEQVESMFNNYKHYHYLHNMDFALAEWGTKWNACETEIVNDKKVTFNTAWTCPINFLISLSQKFPKDKITVWYADEDRGHNCGKIILQNGEIIYDHSQSSFENLNNYNWKRFAYSVWNS